MPRFLLRLEYDGTPFEGWQRQACGPSVQAALEAAIEAFCGQRAVVQAAGRTDAGVHALGQVAHVDLDREATPERLAGALNAHLRPLPVVVLEARRVPTSFHARFSAPRRQYRLSHPEQAGAARARPRPRVARAGTARCRADARGGAAARRPARLHQLPRQRMPGAQPREDARSPSCPARRLPHRGRGWAPDRSSITRCGTWSAR